MEEYMSDNPVGGAGMVMARLESDRWIPTNTVTIDENLNYYYSDYSIHLEVVITITPRL